MGLQRPMRLGDPKRPTAKTAIALALDGFSIENINDGGHPARTMSKAGSNHCQNSIVPLGVLAKVAVKNSQSSTRHESQPIMTKTARSL
jgi:hypothetical protein